MKLYEKYLVQEGNYLKILNEANAHFNYFLNKLKGLDEFLINEYEKIPERQKKGNMFYLPNNIGTGYINLNDNIVILDIISKQANFSLVYECNPDEDSFHYDNDDKSIYISIKTLPFAFLIHLIDNFKYHKNTFIHEYKHYIQQKMGYDHKKHTWTPEDKKNNKDIQYSKNKNRYYLPDENYKKYINHHTELDAFILDNFSVFIDENKNDPIISHYHNNTKISKEQLTKLLPKSVMQSKKTMIDFIFKYYYKLYEYNVISRKKIIKKLSVLYDDFMNKIIEK
jgi:hypothetical protein